jgi:hypothetical protein
LVDHVKGLMRDVLMCDSLVNEDLVMVKTFALTKDVINLFMQTGPFGFDKEASFHFGEEDIHTYR